MSKQKKQNRQQGRDLRGSAPIAGQNRTDTAANAQDPMADPLEMRMKREGRYVMAGREEARTSHIIHRKFQVW